MKGIVARIVISRIIFGIFFGLVSAGFYVFLIWVVLISSGIQPNYIALAIAVPISSSIFVGLLWGISNDPFNDYVKQLHKCAEKGKPVYLEPIKKVYKAIFIVGLVGWIISGLSSVLIFFWQNWFFLIPALLIPMFGTMVAFGSTKAEYYEKCPECHALCSIVEDGKVEGSYKVKRSQDEKTETYSENVATVYDDKGRVAGHVERDRDVKYVRDVTEESYQVHTHCVCCGYKDKRNKSNTEYGEWK